jgi:hypothetical protein
MKTIIASVKGPPLRRVLCSFLFGAAAVFVVPTNIQAATIQAPGDIVWVTIGNTIAKYNANGTAINTNFITEQPIPMPNFPGAQGFAYLPSLGGIVVSNTTLYVAAEWIPDMSYAYALLKGLKWMWYINYVIATYDAGTGNLTNSFAHRISTSTPQPPAALGPAGMALSATNYYVANSGGNSITQGGNLLYIANSPGTKSPYALAVGGPVPNVLYVTNNAQLSNGNFYISKYSTANSVNGVLLKSDFIDIATGGLYGLALSKDNTILYVSVYSGGNGPGVYTYDAIMGGQPLHGPLVSVNEPRGIAIGSPPLNEPNGNPTLYVASYQDFAIYEFDAITGTQLPYSIKLSKLSGAAPTNITVEPAAALVK